MASDVDICNIALGRLGDSATVSSINPPEGSAQAEHCKRFYAIARDTLLEMHAWGFATRRVTLALLSDPPSTNWTYAYGVPSDYLAAINVLADGDADDVRHDFELESVATGGMILYTNVDGAILRYIARVTDTTKFTPLFTDTMGWLLASYLAGPILKGTDGIAAGRAAFQTAMGQLARAAASDANRRHVTLNHKPSWMTDRDNPDTFNRFPDPWTSR